MDDDGRNRYVDVRGLPAPATCPFLFEEDQTRYERTPRHPDIVLFPHQGRYVQEREARAHRPTLIRFLGTGSGPVGG